VSPLELLGKLRFRLEMRRARRGLPHEAYTAAGARFLKVNQDPRYVVPEPQVDVLDATRRNHELVRRVAADVGVGTFVVHAPPAAGVVLGIEEGAAAPFVEALRRAAEREPVYVRMTTVAGQRSAGPAIRKLPTAAREVGELARIEVFRHYREPSTGQSFGAKNACWVEVWREDDAGELVAPGLNGRVGTISIEDRRAPVTVDVHGSAERTFAALAAPTALEVDFPIDVVYMWVDGQDPAWRERKAARLAEMTGRPPVADSLRSVRFDQGDELRFSLRSLHRYAPWVRRIFLVTDQQRPPWLVEHPGALEVVDHRDFLPAEGLPTFNSHAISGGLHRIDGLAEHFLVINDDVLLGRPLAPEAFFLSNGVARFFPSRAALPSGPPTDDDLPLVAARKRSQHIIESRTGLRPNFGFKHTPVAFRRSWLRQLEDEVPEWAGTLRSPFRAHTDIVPEWLHHWIGYADGRCLPSDLDYAYFDIGSDRAVHKLRGTVLQARRPEVLCVNDVTETDGGADRHERLNAVLQELYPHRSPYEAVD
jgi:hypothetical protein